MNYAWPSQMPTPLCIEGAGCCVAAARSCRTVSAEDTHLKKQDSKGGSAVAGPTLPSVLQDLHGHGGGRQSQAATKNDSSRAGDIGQSHCCTCHCCQCDHHLQWILALNVVSCICVMQYTVEAMPLVAPSSMGGVGPELDMCAWPQLSEAYRQGERASQKANMAAFTTGILRRGTVRTSCKHAIMILMLRVVVSERYAV